MAEYMLAYHGGGMPQTPEDEAREMAAWGDWMASIGKRMVNPGAPVGKSMTVSASGVVGNGGSNPLSGYSIVEAESIEAACEMAAGCPINASGGSVEVAPIVHF